MNTPVILTMHDASFEAACKQLQEVCTRQGKPDLVIGIVRGGKYVSERMFEGVPHVMVTLQRQATRYKSVGIVRWLLRHLPYVVLDAMRKAEAMYREHRAPMSISGLVLDTSVTRAIASARRILIVDDSVDTGAIMLSVHDAITQRMQPGATVATAAITVTTPTPLISPDYALYRNRTLIRFPWSNDYKRPTTIKNIN